MPKDIKIFLVKYRNKLQPITAPETNKRSGPCHLCGGKICNRIIVRCNDCENFVCEKHSKHTKTCNDCE